MFPFSYVDFDLHYKRIFLRFFVVIVGVAAVVAVVAVVAAVVADVVVDDDVVFTAYNLSLSKVLPI